MCLPKYIFFWKLKIIFRFYWLSASEDFSLLNFSIFVIVKQHKLVECWTRSHSDLLDDDVVFLTYIEAKKKRNNVYKHTKNIANKASASETNMTFIYFISIFVDFLINFVNFHFPHSSYFLLYVCTIELLNRRRCCYCHFHSFPLISREKWKNNLAL